jgi:hypothetical protein
MPACSQQNDEEAELLPRNCLFVRGGPQRRACVHLCLCAFTLASTGVVPDVGRAEVHFAIAPCQADW